MDSAPRPRAVGDLMVQAEDIDVSLGGRPILHGVSLEVNAGELVAVVDPNGSGKTTLIRAISGDVAYRGSVRLGGTDLHSLKPWQAAERRAVMPQANVLSFLFTVREVVALGLVAGRSGLNCRERDRLPEQALERVDLGGFAGRFYGDLSGGEQQRVQLARVLCQAWEPVLDGQPRVLILDEPVAGLDIHHQLVVMDIARAFAAGGGAVLAILHDLNLAGRYADGVLAMKNGRTAGFGRRAAILEDALMSHVFDCGLTFAPITRGIAMRLAG